MKIGVGGNEALELVRSGEPQKSPRGVEKKNRVAKNCISIRETILASDQMENPKRARSRGVNEGQSCKKNQHNWDKFGLIKIRNFKK